MISRSSPDLPLARWLNSHPIEESRVSSKTDIGQIKLTMEFVEEKEKKKKTKKEREREEERLYS